MAKTVKFGKNPPSEKELAWFSKHIGPRTHYLIHTIGGKGWNFKREQDNPWSNTWWYLTVEDEKMLTYWMLQR